MEQLCVWLGRTHRVQNCPGILGLEQGIRAGIALPLPAVLHSKTSVSSWCGKQELEGVSQDCWRMFGWCSGLGPRAV